MAETTKKQNTIKFMAKKVANNGDENDYEKIPFGVDSENIDRPDGRTGEETFIDLLNGVNLGVALKYEDPYLYLLDGTGKSLSRVIITSTSHKHSYTETITKEATYTETGLKTCTCACGDSYTEEIPILTDDTSPSGSIKIGSNTYSSLSESISFDTYFNSSQNVTIEGSDSGSGVKEIAYHLSNVKVNEADLPSLTWTPYSQPFSIEPNNNYIVYARITDNTDNITYINSNGIVLDNIAPVFNGLEDGGSYPEGTVLTVEDGETLTVNGVAVDLVNNTYTFNIIDNYQLSIADKAGNTASINIIIEHEKAEIDNWEYTLDDTNNTVTLTKYIGNSNDVTVQSTYDVNGKEYCTIINSSESVPVFETIRESVTSINFELGVKANCCEYMFYKCTVLTNLNLKGLDTSNVENMHGMFYFCNSIKVLDLSNFATSNVINMHSMFGNCTSLSDIIFDDNFDTSNVTNMHYMFGGCSSLVTVDLREFITNNVLDMNQMFSYCSKLVNLNITSFDTHNVKDMAYMFRQCSSVTFINVSKDKWIINNDCKTTSMFSKCGVSEVTYV